ncbi:integrase core domain-containing protein [Prosthecomicrobium hirschii]|uniref:integrase core domain-containing protein n=1 Tax=Prosthecodimorpha hirschii TaxID=665126 RepID=UPI0009FB2427
MRRPTPFLAWQQDHRVAWHAIAPAKPIQNTFVASLNGRFGDERRDEYLFQGRSAASGIIRAWCFDDHDHRLHTILGGRTPNAFATRSQKDQNQIRVRL